MFDNPDISYYILGITKDDYPLLVEALSEFGYSKWASGKSLTDECPEMDEFMDECPLFYLALTQNKYGDKYIRRGIKTPDYIDGKEYYYCSDIISRNARIESELLRMLNL